MIIVNELWNKQFPPKQIDQVETPTLKMNTNPPTIDEAIKLMKKIKKQLKRMDSSSLKYMEQQQRAYWIASFTMSGPQTPSKWLEHRS